MEAFNMAILLWSIWMGEHLCELILLKELLNCLGYKPAIVIIADLDLHFFTKAIIWLKMIQDDIFPDAFNLRLFDLITDMPAQDNSCKCIQHGKNICKSAVLFHPNKFYVHLQYL